MVHHPYSPLNSGYSSGEADKPQRAREVCEYWNNLVIATLLQKLRFNHFKTLENGIINTSKKSGNKKFSYQSKFDF